MLKFGKLYESLITKYAKLVIAFAVFIVAIFAYNAPKFYLDASADSLSLKNDQALKYYRSIKARYGSDDFLIITYTPIADMFSGENLANLEKLQNELEQIDRIEKITSILNVPLLQSPPITLAEISEETINLLHPKADLANAPNEILTSPLYNNALISKDGKTTAILALFKRDKTYQKLLNERNRLQEKELNEKLKDYEADKLAKTTIEFKNYSRSLHYQQDRDIALVREIMSKYKDKGTLYLGGVPMIMTDSLEFIKKDLEVFGVAVVAFIILILILAFRSARFVILPLAICLIVSIMMVGYLGMVAWPVTTVSSNFISLLLILTLSITIHLTVRYREEYLKNPKATHKKLVIESAKKMALPCFYTTITTMIAFASLIVSKLKPVIDFGWMMCIGLAVAFIFAFLLFPALHLFLKKPIAPRKEKDITSGITNFFAKAVQHKANLILAIFAIFTAISIYGITKLSVENRFIDYYKESTEIYQGMQLIDNELGGTTPLDVVLDAPKSYFEELEEESFSNIFGIEEEEDQGPQITQGYWFNSFMYKKIGDYHQYLDSLPETGKVLSLDTTIKMLETIDQELTSNSFTLGVLYKKVPEDIKSQIFKPYISEDGNQLRYSIRVYESSQNLKRNKLIKKIKTDLVENYNLEEDQVKLTGMLVLYNNILQTLFKSQILTIGIVFFAIFIMFCILFRNIKIAAIAIIPNVTAAVFILGLMGLAGISLDIMTITIAAIVIGIAVDDTIHYTHRFITEYKQHKNYLKAVENSHSSIGRAMYFTTVIITLGFSILVLSNFMPTIYFGTLTGLSMVIALLADLTLLPVLLVKFKPLGK